MLAASLVIFVSLCWGIKKASIGRVPFSRGQIPPLANQVLLVALTLVLSMWTVARIARREAIHMLFPCHVVTVGWIFLLAHPGTSRLHTAVFRLNMNDMFSQV